MFQLLLKKKIKIYVETRPLYFKQNTVLTCEIIEEEKEEKEEENQSQQKVHEESFERLRNSNISSCENSCEVLCVFYNPLYKIYGKHVYLIDVSEANVAMFNIESSYVSLIQTYKPKIVYACYSVACEHLKTLVYDDLCMYKIHSTKCRLFKCTLNVIISVIEKCEHVLLHM